MERQCSNCHNDFTPKSSDQKFCSRSCSASVNNRLFPKRVRKKRFCSYCGNLLNYDNHKYCSLDCQMALRRKNIDLMIENGNYHTKSHRVLREYLIRFRGQRCESCGLMEWLQKPISLEVEHMDGNSENNRLDNVKLLCPNCHSQTPTYKGKNRGNGRYWRKKRYKNGLSY